MTSYSAPLLTAHRLYADADAHGQTIAELTWGSAGASGLGWALLDLGASLAERGGADRRGDLSIRCCGTSKGQAAGTLDRVRAAFTGWRPTTRPDAMAVELDCGPAIQDTSIAERPRWSITITFRIES